MLLNYKEISEEALSLYKEKKYDEAELLYLKLLKENPDDVNLLNLYGLLCITINKPDKAVSVFSKAVVLNSSAYLISNLAKAYLHNNEVKKSIELFIKASEKKQDDDVFYSLAIAYKKNRQLDKAAESYQKALELNPNHYNACYNLASLYKQMKNIKKTLLYANKCLEIKPMSEDVYTLLSTMYEEIGAYKKSIAELENATKVNHKEHLYFYNLGVLYSKIDDDENSILNYLKVLKLKPDHIESLVNLCTLYKKKNKDEAMKYIMIAKQLSPNEKNVLLNLAQLHRDMFNNEESINVLNELLSTDTSKHEAYSLIGMNYMDLGNYETALEYYNKALEIMPEDANYLHGKAIAYKYLGKTKECKELLEKILKIDPKEKQSEIILGMMYLTDKNFEKGMKLYRQRNQDTKFADVFKKKCWEPNIQIDGKNILIYSNCGLGDTIMYARYLNEINSKAAKVVLQTDKTLVNLLKSNFKYIEIIEKSIKPEFSYDTVLSVMDLQYALNQNFDSIPSSNGYIKADDTLVEKFSKQEALQSDKKSVGLFWQGNKKIFKNRSLKFSMLSDILDVESCQFYSFQIDENDEKDSRLINLNKYIQTYNDTAALLSNMDLLITIDSSIAHMAGALGVKTFLLLPYTAEWRWFNDTECTPWYNSVKIFRQTEIGNWSTVLDKVKDALNKL